MYDVFAMANNKEEMNVYFSSHAIQRIRQRIATQVEKVTQHLSFLLLNSCSYLDECVRVGEPFYYVVENSLFVCKYDLDNIYVITAYRINNLDECILRAKSRKMQMVCYTDAYLPCA